MLWSQWLLAFLPCALVTIVAAWLTGRWLYPVESDVLPGGRQSLRETWQAMGPWSAEEQKALAALLLAIGLWTTDFLHQLNPAVIAIGVGLLLTLPKVGVLDTKALKSVNFLLVVFVGGALSMGTVLAETEVLHLVMGRLLAWLGPLLREAWQASVILYRSNALYHFLLGNELTMVSISLPVMLKVAEDNGYNAAAMGMIWAFAGGGKLFAYQASGLVVGYSYGYFAAKDLVKVGAILTPVEGAILTVLVPLYWPLIGLPWQVTPAAPVAASTDHETAQPPPAPRQPAHQASGGAIIQQVQAHLTELSLDPSPTDSQLGPRAGAVSSQAQATSAVPSTRRLDRDTRNTIGPGRGGTEAVLIKDVQARLRDAGFDPGPIDGRFGPRTEAALRRFQVASGLPVTGRIDAETLAAFEHRPRPEDVQASEGRHPAASLDPIKPPLSAN